MDRQRRPFPYLSLSNPCSLLPPSCARQDAQPIEQSNRGTQHELLSFSRCVLALMTMPDDPTLTSAAREDSLGEASPGARSTLTSFDSGDFLPDQPFPNCRHLHPPRLHARPGLAPGFSRPKIQPGPDSDRAPPLDGPRGSSTPAHRLSVFYRPHLPPREPAEPARAPRTKGWPPRFSRP